MGVKLKGNQNLFQREIEVGIAATIDSTARFTNFIGSMNEAFKSSDYLRSSKPLSRKPKYHPTYKS
jgi:hypothetical protein